MLLSLEYDTDTWGFFNINTNIYFTVVLDGIAEEATIRWNSVMTAAIFMLEKENC